MPRWLLRTSKPDDKPPETGDLGWFAFNTRRQVIDSATYDAVFRRTIESIDRISLAILQDADEAHDATSAVLEKLLTKLPQTEVRDFDAWLRMVAKTTAIDHLRALRRHRYASLEEGETVEDPSPTPEDLVLDDDLRRQLAHHLSSLTPDQRQVVALRQERLSSKQIGELLGKNAQWVDTTYFRALRKLRQLLAEAESEKGGTS